MQFIFNKYTNLYFAIISNSTSKNRSKQDGYYENHHIVPRCLGGTDVEWNLVLLTAREHYLCHWLLTKMVPGQLKYKTQFAFFRMSTENQSQQRNITSRQYDIARKHHAEACRVIGGQKKGKKWNAPDGEIERRRDKWLNNNPSHDPSIIAKIVAKKAKTYIITHANGLEEIVTNMAAYCRVHGLHKGNMTSVAKGKLKHYKGMVVRYA